MKTKAVIVILVVVCVGLGIAFFATKKQADEQHAADVTLTVDFSNQVVTANKQLDELGQVNLTLSNDLTSSQQRLALSAGQLAQLSNSLAAANTTLVTASATLADTRSSLASAQEQITNLDTRISDLETQNKVLDQQAAEMTVKLAQLTAQIETTKNQLAIAVTNNAFLQGELQKQLAQKAELEHKFNDLDELRVQVKTLKSELFIARHLQWMKNDNGGKKGAELLLRRNLPPSSQSSSMLPPAYDLNVEVGSDGTVKVIPPLGATNRPAH
jgi:chromosome segregation ATPase